VQETSASAKKTCPKNGSVNVSKIRGEPIGAQLKKPVSAGFAP
jgi:hypothetical protein